MDAIIITIKALKNFLLLWFGQSVSSMGSAMTGFAITLWAYEATGSALALSISSAFIMVPRMIAGVFAGPLVDRLDKKTVMICADIGAGLCTLSLFLLLKQDALRIGHIYILNAISSVLSSFQSPACSVAVSAVVPRQHYVRVNGLQSFSEGIIQMLAPVFAAALLGMVGMGGVIVIDFLTMIFACLSLAFLVKLPVIGGGQQPKLSARSFFNDLLKGFEQVKSSGLLLKLMSFMMFINFVAGIAFYGLLSPMILARTANDGTALALVNGAVGLGSIVGALIVMGIPTPRRKVKTMFLCIALSFLLGDILFALGNGTAVWGAAGFLSSVLLPVYMANESYFWRTVIPIEAQGRAFSLKFALQSSVIPIGSLMGGALADYALEPFMQSMGRGPGEGMALIFMVTGVAGVVLSMLGFFSRSMQKAEIDARE